SATTQLGKALWIQAPRLVGLSAATVVFMWAADARPQAARLCRTVLFVVVAADLLASNSALNPTAGADVLAPPAWVASASAHPHDRVYIGPHMVVNLPDDAKVWRGGPPVSERSDAEVRSRQSIDYAWFPSAYRLRDTLSSDATAMWSGQY